MSTITISISDWVGAILCVMLAVSAAINIWHGVVMREYLKERR